MKKTKIIIWRVPMAQKRRVIFERDLARARNDAANAESRGERYDATRRIERLTERRTLLYT